MMVVPVDPGPPMTLGAARLLFEGNYETGVAASASYDVSSDGQRFLMVRPAGEGDPEAGRMNIVHNWFEELTRLVPTN